MIGCYIRPKRGRSALFALVVLSLGSLAHTQSWEIPRSASTEKSPLSPTSTVLKHGRSLYASHCAKCHGPEGEGDGPDMTNDLAHRPADLTSAFRAQFNPDGVVFYRIWNGRTQPTMPAFRAKLSRNDVWAIVEYVKTLRKAPDR
jgi:mono/diheme cytochrome c family protein